MNGTSVLTLSILTIPEREPYLRRLFASIREMDLDVPPHIDVVYNGQLDGSLGDVREHIRGIAGGLELDVYFNAGATSIVAGRNLQLSVCRTPLIAFIDDDITVHGDFVPAILETLAARPIGLLGFPSYDGDSDRLVKPRPTTPSVDWQGFRFKPVQGMVCAGYRTLLADIGAFNPRRQFWGEWTELNLRLWRSGFPTGYEMDRAFLRHWQDAPSSPTRNMDGRERHVVWGLICTALEYDAVDVTGATEVFWRLVEDRYLAYSYGDELSPKNVLKTVLELVPRISSEWGSIQAFRTQVAAHRFQFAPFHPFSLDEVTQVVEHASVAILPYRQQVSRDQQHAARITPRAVRRMRTPPTLGEAFGRLRDSFRSLRARL